MSAPGANRLPVLVQEIGTAHQSCRRSAADTVRHAVEAGRGLNEAKLLLPHGEWETWLRLNLPGIGLRTAQRYMRAAARAGKNDTGSFFRLRDLIAPQRERTGRISERLVLILTPSTHLGYTHVTLVNVETWEASGFHRPVREDAIPSVVQFICGSPIPQQWLCAKSRPHEANPHLTGAERVVTDEAAANADAVIQAADQRLDELGYHGPKRLFGGHA